MDKARALIKRLLYPTRLVVIAVPPLSFAALVFIFAAKDNRSIPAYLIEEGLCLHHRERAVRGRWRQPLDLLSAL